MQARNNGFTLVELVVVVLVIAILMTLILPSYQRQLVGTRRSIASAALLQTLIRQEQYFVEHKRYAQTLVELDYPASPYAIDAQGNVLAEDAQNRIYLINLATTTNAFTLLATPQLGQAADQLCGALSLDSIGIKRVTGEADVSACW
ncbi:MAG: type IV pilin protein [Halioglobus sp.]